MNHKTTLFALILAMPGSAWSQDPQVACDSLKDKAAALLGKGAELRCEAQGDTLTVIAASIEAYEALRKAEFPEYKYAGFKIAKPFHIQPMRDAVAEPPEHLLKFQSAALPTTTKAVNYDGAATLSGGVLILAGGPPGQLPQAPADEKPPVRRGPPGQTAPGQPQPEIPRSGPPGQRPPSTRPGGPPGNDAPPQTGTQPPSKPTPVFIPRAPAPNYWNTIDWGTVPMWSSLPNDWEQATVDENGGRYVSRWYPYSQPFLRSLGHERVSRDGHHRRGNDDVSIDLFSREVMEIKQCYYQGVYRLKWNSFEGSWDGQFSHYRAACKADQQHSDSGNRARVNVRFAMNGQELMPWEVETVRATFDGRNVGTSVLNASYQYRETLGGMPGNVTYEAGAKLLTTPDENGVTVSVEAQGRNLKVRVFDKWAGYYSGETLEVSARLMRVNNSWNPFASNFNEGEFKFDNGTQWRFASGTPPGASGAGMTYDKDFGGKTCGTYFVEAVSFRRANNSQPDNRSRISSDQIMHIGTSRRVEICK